VNLVRNPTINVAVLYGLSAASSAYSPTLSAAPTDWTLYIDYTGGGLSSPTGVALDSGGNVWVANNAKAASLFSPLGKPVFASGITGSGLNASFGIAVDSANHAWIPNEPGSGAGGNSITLLDSTGATLSGANGYTSGGLDYPIAVAIDTDGSAWIVDYGNSHLTHLSSSGQALSGASGYSSSQLAFPVSVALDGSHNAWVPNQSGTTVTRVSADGSQFTSYDCCSAPSNLAIDRSGNVWVANFYASTLSEISANGTVLANGTIGGGGLDHPQGMAIDGAGNLWISNYRSSRISKFSGASSTLPGTALSPAAGLGSHAALLESYAIAVDSSGNLWVTNYGSNTLTEFIGLAAPVRTPQIGPSTAP
jgi:streptogramin lyase